MTSTPILSQPAIPPKCKSTTVNPEFTLPMSHLDSVSSLVFSEDSQWLFVGSYDGTMTIYQILPQYDHKNRILPPIIHHMATILLNAPPTTILPIPPNDLHIRSNSHVICLIGLSTGEILCCTFPSRPISLDHISQEEDQDQHRLSPQRITPHLSLFHSVDYPIFKIKYNRKHDVIIVIDLMTSIFVFSPPHLIISDAIATAPFSISYQPPIFTQIASHVARSTIFTGKSESSSSTLSSSAPSSLSHPLHTHCLKQVSLTTEDHSSTEYSPRNPTAVYHYHTKATLEMSPHDSTQFLEKSIPPTGKTVEENSPLFPSSLPSLSTFQTIFACAVDTFDDILLIALPNTITIYHITSSHNTDKTAILTTTAIVSKIKTVYSPLPAQITALLILPNTVTRTINSLTQCIEMCMGYTVSCDEGRVAVDYIVISTPQNDFHHEQNKITIVPFLDQAKRFAFKCHRTDFLPSHSSLLSSSSSFSPSSSDYEPQKEVLYPVTDLTYHNPSHTFATCGGDGSIVVWSNVMKKKVSSFGAKHVPITTAQFSSDGKYIVWAETPYHDGLYLLSSPLTVALSTTSPQKIDITKDSFFPEFGYLNAKNYPKKNLPSSLDHQVTEFVLTQLHTSSLSTIPPQSDERRKLLATILSTWSQHNKTPLPSDFIAQYIDRFELRCMMELNRPQPNTPKFRVFLRLVSNSMISHK